jgi:hypothetical protein
MLVFSLSSHSLLSLSIDFLSKALNDFLLGSEDSTRRLGSWSGTGPPRLLQKGEGGNDRIEGVFGKQEIRRGPERGKGGLFA